MRRSGTAWVWGALGCRGHQRLLRCPRLLKVLDFLGFLCIGSHLSPEGYENYLWFSLCFSSCLGKSSGDTTVPQAACQC